MSRVGFGLVAITWVVIAGCSVSASDSGEDSTAYTPPDSLEQARDLWRQHDIEQYTVTAQQSCYCLKELVQPIRLQVNGGAVVAMEGLKQPLKNLNAEDARRLTVEGLFQFIEKAERDDVHKLDVSYHGQYGFPTSIDYDRRKMMADDELSYRLTDFKPGATR